MTIKSGKATMFAAGRISPTPKRPFKILGVSSERSAEYEKAKLARWQLDPRCNQCNDKIETVDDAEYMEDVIGQKTPGLVHRTCVGEYIQKLALRATHFRGRR